MTLQRKSGETIDLIAATTGRIAATDNLVSARAMQAGLGALLERSGLAKMQVEAAVEEVDAPIGGQSHVLFHLFDESGAAAARIHVPLRLFEALYVRLYGGTAAAPATAKPGATQLRYAQRLGRQLCNILDSALPKPDLLRDAAIDAAFDPDEQPEHFEARWNMAFSVAADGIEPCHICFALSDKLADAMPEASGRRMAGTRSQPPQNHMIARAGSVPLIVRSELVAAQMAELLSPLLLPVASLLLASVVAAIAGPALLGSLGWRSKAMAFKTSRLNPLAGMKRIFGLQGLIELVKALAKAALLGVLGYWLLSDQIAGFMGFAALNVQSSSAILGQSLIALLFALGIGMLLIALLDVPAQYFQRFRRLRMTREQVKEELRQSEGAPELKAQLRARQQAILSQSARKAMGEANVVLNNPSHFSVALRYRPGKDPAPVVVARGRDEVALAMRELARERDVPMLDYPMLTRALYFTTRAGQAIPEDLYHAVAVILAFIFRLDSEAAKGVAPPQVEVPSSKRFDQNGKPEGG